MENTIEDNNMLREDNRNTSMDLFINKINYNENGLPNDENNEEDELSNNKDQVEPFYEHT